MTDSFKGPAAKDFNEQHFYDNHHPDGKGAKTPGARKDLFPKKWTKEDIAASIRRAWSFRKKIKTQVVLAQDKRIKYEGVDPKSGLTIHMWYNAVTKIVETAYPVRGQKK